MSRRESRIKTVVTRIDPVTERRRGLFRLALVVAAAVGGFYLGRAAVLQQPQVPLQDPAESLRAVITRLETRAEVDRATVSTLRFDLAEARAQIEELERELGFYREVMAPEEQSALMVLRPPTFVAGEAPGIWRYQLVVQQGSRVESARRGALRVELAGRAQEAVNGPEIVYRLNELDADLADDVLALNFRYFQKLEGAVRLPPQFVPTKVRMTVTLDAPESTSLSREFPWLDVAMSAVKKIGGDTVVDDALNRLESQ